MIIIDIESTGIDPKKHSIVSIGAIDLNNPERQFYIENQVWKGSEIYMGDKILGYKPAMLMNGFTIEEIHDENKPLLKQAIISLIKWIKESDEKTIGGHNPHFDLDFLKNSAEMYGIEWPFGDSAVDIKSLVYMHQVKRGLSPNKLKSDDCFIYAGLPKEEIPHNALYGAKLKAEAISRIIFNKKLLQEFSKYSIPEYLEQD